MVNPASQYTPLHINNLEDGYGALTEIGACWTVAVCKSALDNLSDAPAESRMLIG